MKTLLFPLLPFVLVAACFATPAVIALTAPQPAVADARDSATEGTLTTAVQDPRHPEEPWIVVTIRRPDESIEAAVARHLAMLDAVRRALR